MVIVPSLLLWVHHSLVMGLNPFPGTYFLILSILLAVLFCSRLFRRLQKNKIAHLDFSPTMMFFIAFAGWLIYAAFEYVVRANSTIDIHLHDTYYVVSHFNVEILFTFIFGIFSCIYYWFPNIFGRELNKPLGYIHFWITFLWSLFILPQGYVEGLAGMPGRYIDYRFYSFSYSNHFISNLSILVIMAQLIFVFNFLSSIFTGKRNK